MEPYVDLTERLSQAFADDGPPAREVTIAKAFGGLVGVRVPRRRLWRSLKRLPTIVVLVGALVLSVQEPANQRRCISHIKWVDRGGAVHTVPDC